MSDMRTVTGRLARFDLQRFIIGAILWMPYSIIPLVSGIILKALFDRISHGQPIELQAAWWLCAAFVAAELVRATLPAIASIYGVYWWCAAATILRGNLLSSLLTSPGPAAGRMPASSGESLARMRSDVAALVDFVDEFIPIIGTVLFAIGAFIIMAQISWPTTLVLLIPVLAIGILSTWASAKIRRLHRRAQETGAMVTAHVGETVTNILTIKTSGAEGAAVRQLRRHNRPRRDAAVKDRLATDTLNAATSATVEISIGLVLLLSVGAMRRGQFTIGDFALFTTAANVPRLQYQHRAARRSSRCRPIASCLRHRHR